MVEFQTATIRAVMGFEIFIMLLVIMLAESVTVSDWFCVIIFKGSKGEGGDIGAKGPRVSN